MSALNIATKYAQSLFDVVPKEDRQKTLKELQQLTTVFTKEVIGFFSSPHNTPENKKAAVNAAIEGKVSGSTYNFILTLVENDRLAFWSHIIPAYEKLVLSATGTTKGTLWAASEVTPEFIKKVEDQATKAIGQTVELKFEKKPDLIAGFKVQVGGWTLDDSAAAHLRILKDELMKRGL